jgi:PAS domain S-box-containing protein
MLEKEYYNDLIREMGRVAKIGGWEFDVRTGKGTWTEETARIHEVDPSDETNMSYGVSFYHDESRQKIDKAIEKAIHDGIPYDIELELTTAKGHHKWVRTIGKPLFENDKVIKIRGSFQDITERKKIEVNLIKAKKDAERYLDMAANIFLMLDHKGSITMINQKGLDILEYEREELLGKNWFGTCLPKDVYPIVIDAFHRIVKGETERLDHFENEVITKNGQRRYISWFNTIIKNDRDEFESVLSSGVDISDQRIAREKIRESEEKYRHLFETMDQGVVYQNPKSEIISANPAAERILGLTLDQMKGRTSVDPRWKAVDKHRENLPGEKHPAMVALQTGKEVHNFLQGIFNPQLNDYVWIIVNARPLFHDKEKKPYGVYSTFLDITERIKAETELQRNEKKLSSLFENMNEGFALHKIVTDKNGKPVDYVFLDLNQAFEKMTGLTKAQVIGKKVTDVIPGIEKDPADWIGKYGKVAKENITLSFEDYSEPLNRWYFVSAFSPEKDHFATTIFDITERKKIEIELIQLKTELEKKVQQQTHELHERLNELERFRDATVNREFRMKELREEIKLLKQKLDK